MNEHDELKRLMSRLFDEERLTSEETVRLNELLRGDPVACERYLDHMAVHAQLEREFGTVVPEAKLVGLREVGTRRTTNRWARKKWGLWLALASAAVVVMSLLINGTEKRIALPSDYVATLVEDYGSAWRDGRTIFHGQRLTAGRLELSEGRAVVNFDAGAQMVLIAPAHVEIESAGGVRLKSGKIAVRAPEEAFGFRVTTADGEFVDLGTEFTLATGKQGTVCNVLEGEVQWQGTELERGVALLAEGEARRFARGKVETVQAEASRYRDYVPRLQQRTDHELLAYEPFDYADGKLQAETLQGGFGWPAPWRGRFAPGDQIDVDPQMQIVRRGGILAPDDFEPAQGGSFVFHETKQWRLRELPTPVDFSTEGAYYLSFLVRRPAEEFPAKSKSGRLVVTLRSLADYWAHSVGFAVTSDGRPVIIADGNNNAAEMTVPEGETLLVVCKVATSTRGPDQLFLKVYTPGEPIDTRDPLRWTVTGRSLELNSQMNYLILGMMGDVRWAVDELRFGTTWRGVVPTLRDL